MKLDPHHWPLVLEYFDHVEENKYPIPICEYCAETFFPPRVLCPYCLSDSLSFKTAAGTGEIYSFSVVRTDYHDAWGHSTPYVNALIELSEGQIIFSNVVNCTPEDLTVGTDVKVTFEQSPDVDELKLPFFEPRVPQ
jgi:uncharacterized OB-fold protein